MFVQMFYSALSRGIDSFPKWPQEFKLQLQLAIPHSIGGDLNTVITVEPSVGEN